MPNPGPRQTRLTVAFNGDIELIPRLARFPEVESIFGKLPKDVVGGGRESFVLANIDFGHIGECIREAHHHDIAYVYLLNASCMSNLEHTRDFNRELGALLNQICDVGADAVVVTTPYLLEFVKRNFPNLRVSISTFSIIDSAKKARRWEDKGADRLILHPDLTRDFEMLRKIRKAVDCELEIFANCMCMYQCPYPHLHSCCKAHASCSGGKSKGFYLDYYSFQCAYSRLANPTEFARGNFVRPEDVAYYSELGIDVMKLSDRFKSSDWIVNAVQAYATGRYDGNLVDIIAYPYMQGPNDRLISDPARFLARPEHINVEVLEVLKRLGEPEEIVHIDNRKLDGFLEFFKHNQCEDFTCDDECKHCLTYTKKAVTVDEEKAERRIADFRRMFDMLEGGEAFENNSVTKSLGTALTRILSSTKNVYQIDAPQES